ncbi:mucin-1 isoform X3 [Trachypithecus francoisi]|uniref:mucin-1 isoform X3 n=1 Tax=Trachypithecus francoisi TaxID=54180 RepID=UPI00141B979E|nr:mucin-1 isoform X3 [Trachypithecus francoisi]
MTPGTQSPFFLLLILTVLTGSGHTSSTPGGEKETSATQRSSMPISTKNAVSMTSSVLSSHSPVSGSSTTQGQDVTPALDMEPATGSTITLGRDVTSGPDTSAAPGSTAPPAHDVTSAPDTSAAPGSTAPTAHDVTSAPDTSAAPGSTVPPAHDVTSAPDTSAAPGSTTPPAHDVTLAPDASAVPGSTGLPAHDVTSAPDTRPALGSTAPPAHDVTFASGSASGSASTLVHNSTSARATTTPASKSTPFSIPSHHSDTPTTLASHSTKTDTSSTHHSTVPHLTSSNHSTSPQLSIGVSFFFLSFHISNLQFNSSLEDPSTNYYQQLQRDISELFLQIYKQGDFLGLSNIKFRPGSVVVQSTLVFREGTTNVHDVETQFNQRKTEAASRYNLMISDISVRDVPFPFSDQSGAEVPGWGIALLVLVCVLVVLAIVYFIALAVCQCRQKNYRQLDIFPARDAYHPMSEYPTYHTHGRYVPPGSTNRSPYEEVSAGNGGSSLSYTNPAVAATSANL